jgi:hypothetical protein
VSAAGGKKATRRKSRAKAQKGWQAPDSPPPSKLLVDAYLSDACAQSGLETDARQCQLEARKALATLYRAQLLERDRLARKANEVARAHDPSDVDNWQSEQKLIAQQAAKAVDPRLKVFFAGLSDQIWRSDDPVTTLRVLLCGVAIRGATRKYGDRDFLIAAEVAGRIHHGEKRDAACGKVSDQFRLSPEAVLNIYKRRDKREVKAQLGLFGLPKRASARSVP